MRESVQDGERAVDAAPPAAREQTPQAQSSARATPRRRARRRLGRRIRAFHLRTEGFTGRAARAWVRIADRELRNTRYPVRDRARAVAWGFTPRLVADFGVTAANRAAFVSPREYLYAHPLNGTYAKWVRDRSSALTVFRPFHEHFVTEPAATAEPAEPAAPSAASGDDPLELRVIMMNPDGIRPVVAEAFIRFAAPPAADDESRPVSYVGRVDPRTGEYAEGRATVDGRLQIVADDPVTGRAFAGTVPGWTEIVDVLVRMCAFAPQLRFVQFRLRVDAGRMRIVRVSPTPAYSEVYPFSPATVAFLRDLNREKSRLTRGFAARTRKGLHNARLKLRRETAKLLYPKGLVPYQAVRWPADIVRDLMHRNGIPFRRKLWAYRHGFLSYRLPQYGVTETTRHELISDFEYRWLRHINRHKHWLEDKVSIKYLAADFDDVLPAYYYFTRSAPGRNQIIPMMNCPDGYGADVDDVLRLAREKGALALKPDEGSHGHGFYRLAWTGDGYTLNGAAAHERDVTAILSDPRNRYLVTEFIEMHPVLAELYPRSVNTIRMIVFKRDGATPQLGNAYLRIGTSASGYVDNTAAGGLVAELDAMTGRFGAARYLARGRVQPSPHHPDTGAPIEGIVPGWHDIVRRVLRMAESFAQLEYLGFDIAVTPDGFKVPEINRFPDYPRIDRLTPDTIEYLLHKLQEKKERYGYDRRRPRTLVTLPRRHR